MKRKKIFIGILSGFFIISLLSLSQFRFQKDNLNKLSVKIANSSANAVYGCCKKDVNDSCDAYGVLIADCDECFAFANCNKKQE